MCADMEGVLQDALEEEDGEEVSGIRWVFTMAGQPLSLCMLLGNALGKERRGGRDELGVRRWSGF